MGNDTEIPDGFEASEFYTLRYLQHGGTGRGCKKNCKGKTIVDVSRIPIDHLTHSDFIPGGATSGCTPHNPVPECNGTLVPDYDSSIFAVHHYLKSIGSARLQKIEHESNKMKKFQWYKDLE